MFLGTRAVIVRVGFYGPAYGRLPMRPRSGARSVGDHHGWRIWPGGRVANIGVHGKPAVLHLEKLWIREVTITTGLVDTSSIPQLLRLIETGRLDPSLFATHHFALGDTMAAYDTFADAANTNALKVVLDAHTPASAPTDHFAAAGVS